MGEEWYYGQDGEQVGPITAEELRRLAASGALRPTDLIWKDGMAEWVPASRIKWLYPGSRPQIPTAKAPQPPVPERPPPTTQEVDEWYYALDGHQDGPVSWAELRQLAASGTIQGTDLVWQEGTPDRVPAAEVSGLIPLESRSGEPETSSQPSEAQPKCRRDNPKTPRLVGGGVVLAGLLAVCVCTGLASLFHGGGNQVDEATKPDQDPKSKKNAELKVAAFRKLVAHIKKIPDPLPLLR